MESTGIVTGAVTLQDVGERLPGVVVTLQDNLSSRTAVTNEDGQYRFLQLRPGAYTLTAVLEGFKTVKEPDIEVHAGQTTVKNIAMQMASISG